MWSIAQGWKKIYIILSMGQKHLLVLLNIRWSRTSEPPKISNTEVYPKIKLFFLHVFPRTVKSEVIQNAAFSSIWFCLLYVCTFQQNCLCKYQHYILKISSFQVETTTTIGGKINEMFVAIPRCGCYAEFWESCFAKSCIVYPVVLWRIKFWRFYTYKERANFDIHRF